MLVARWIEKQEFIKRESREREIDTERKIKMDNAEDSIASQGTSSTGEQNKQEFRNQIYDCSMH